MPFQPGQSGNPTGAKNGSKEWAAALRLAVSEAYEEGKTKLRALAEKTVAEGLAGNMNAIKEIGDRLDGKVQQAVIGGDEDDPAIKVISTVEYHVVYPDGTRAPILDDRKQIEDRDSAVIPAVTAKPAL